jgi:hypothetical protein
MAANRRDHKAESARRDLLAQEAGWNTRAQERYARKKFEEASHDVKGKFNRFVFDHPGLTKSQERRAFRSYWQGLIDPKTREDASRDSPKAEWFVEWLDLDMFHGDYDIWHEMYGED